MDKDQDQILWKQVCFHIKLLKDFKSGEITLEEMLCLMISSN